MANFSRSWWLLLVLAACGDDDGGAVGLEPPTCQPDGVLRYVHDLGGTERTGELPGGSFVFANKLSDDEPGFLEVGEPGNGGEGIHVEFEELIAKGDSAAATGFLKLGELEAGNCETTFVSQIDALPDDGWTVRLVELHAPPYCEGAAIAGSFAACFIRAPF